MSNKRLFITGTVAATLYWLLIEMFNPAFSIFVSELNFPAWKQAILLAAQTFVPFLITIQIGSVADIIGQNKTIVIGASLMIAGCTLIFVNQSFLVLFLVQTLVGIGHITVWLSSQSIVTFIKSGRKESAIANFTLFTAIGQLLGPQLYGWICEFASYREVFIAYIVLTCSFFVMFPFFPKNHSGKKEDIHFLNMYKEGAKLLSTNEGVKVATIVSFSLAFILYLRSTYLPIFLQEKGYSASRIGMIISLWSFASILVRPASAVLIRKFGRLRVTTATLSLGLIGLVCLAFLPQTVGVVIAVMILGMGTGFNQPLAISLVSASTTSNNRGLGMGLRLMSNRLANWICPVVIGNLGGLIGLQGAFIVSAFPLGAISMLSIVMLKRYLYKQPKEEEAL